MILLLSTLVAACAGHSGPRASDAGPATEGASTSRAPATVGQTTAPEPPPEQEPPPLDPAAVLQKRAAKIVDGLSLEEKSGLVIVAAHTGPRAPVELITQDHLGGIIDMDPSLTTRQVREVNAALADAAEAAGRGWPVFLAVDQEGGIVQRAEDELTRFPTFMTYGAADDTGLTRRAAAASGAELRGAGFTVDLAPDADVTTGPEDPTIGSRSAGSDPDLVARHAVAAAEGYLQAGILPVVKHFPGHGSVTTDSHQALPVQSRSLEQLRRSDLVPFVAAVGAALPAVMVGHLQVQALGSTGPSSLDPRVVDGLLRQELGFDGLVVTDALNMAAVTGRSGPGDPAVLALQAGADVVLMPPDPLAARTAIQAAVESGTLDEDRLDEAVTHQIVALLTARDAQTVEPAQPGEAGPVSREASAAAITVVSGPCGGPLVDGGIVPVGDQEAVARLTAAAEQAGLAVDRGTVVELLGYGQRPGGGAGVTVATDTPYVLGRSAAPVRIATYGDTPGAMAALVDVLTGKASAPGRLPVEVQGVSRSGC